MKFSTALVGALASIATAHSDASAGAPKLMGGRKFLSEMKARNVMALPQGAPVTHMAKRQLVDRQSASGRCGKGFGNCASNCCSAEGYCGTGTDYCAAPDCQYQYGPGCDANKVPAGASTANIARPVLGSVPYGGNGIYDCDTVGEIALTFDDGPYDYTSDLLDKLKVYSAKATFFITGNNLGKGAIDSTAKWSDLIKRMVAEGHQVASHTWSHQNLGQVDKTMFNKQMVYNEMAFRNILGYFPTYMRPPYSECNATCGASLKTLGYHVTYFDLDTEGYLHTTPETVQKSKDIMDAKMRSSNSKTDSFLQIEHDIHQQVVYNLTDYILNAMYTAGYKSVTVGKCLNDPQANWYRSGGSVVVPSGSSSSVAPSSTTSTGPSGTSGSQAISTDGSCSSTVTCKGSEFGGCCSQYGYCGSTDAYCGTGCNPASGTCGAVSSSAPPTTSRTTTSTSRPASTSTTSTTTSPTPVPTLQVSPDGSCGGTNKYTCTGSRFGKCCSKGGRCGNSISIFYQPYCGSGCQRAYGVCN